MSWNRVVNLPDSLLADRKVLASIGAAGLMAAVLAAALTAMMQDLEAILSE